MNRMPFPIWRPANTYVGIMFDKKGEYIKQVDMQEYWVWIGVFRFKVE